MRQPLFVISYNQIYGAPMEILNLYSLAHLIIWWMTARFIFRSWSLFFILSISWELLELVLPFDFAIESWINKFSDIVVNTLGFYLGLLMRNKVEV